MPTLGVRFWMRFFVAGAVVVLLVLGVVAAVRTWSDATRRDQFRSDAFEFVLPQHWSCNLEETEWVCQTSESGPPHDAIIILAQKLRGAQDTLEKYEAHLRQPRSSEHGTSEVQHVRRTHVRGQEWVDALHLGSELRDYLTRYLATTTSGRGILITFSAAADRYADYEPDVDVLMESLVVYEASSRDG